MKSAATFHNKLKPFTLTFLNSLLVFLSIGDLQAISKTSFQNTLYSESKNILASESSAKQYPSQDQNTISITGSASRVLDTNVIRLGIRIETLSPDLEEAYANNTQISNDVSDVLKRLRIPNQNITTTNYRVEPAYTQEYNEENRTWSQVFDGYRVVNELEINMNKRKDISEIIDAIMQAGPVYITGINFGFSDELVKQTKDELLELAAQDAYERAKILTDALGVNITDVKSISISQYIPPIPYNYPYAPAAASAAGIQERAVIPPTIYAGTSKVSVDVNVNFSFKNLAGNETAKNETPLQIGGNRTQEPMGEEGNVTNATAPSNQTEFPGPQNATNATQPGNVTGLPPEEIPPEEGNVTQPGNVTVLPPEEGNITQPGNVTVLPPEEGNVTQPANVTGLPPEEGNVTQPANVTGLPPEEIPPEEGNVTQPANRTLPGPANATQPQPRNQTPVEEQPFGPGEQNVTAPSNITAIPEEGLGTEGNITTPEGAPLPPRRNATGGPLGPEANQTAGNQTAGNQTAGNQTAANQTEGEEGAPNLRGGRVRPAII